MHSSIEQRRVLIVEDEGLIALMIRRKLEEAGITVVGIVDDAESALSMAQAERPDLVLMDIHLKGPADGISAAAQIRTNLDIPVLFTTAHSDSETMARAHQSEPAGFIFKPFMGVNFKAQIDAALCRHGLERRLRASEARYRAVVERANDLIYQTDDKGLFTYCNPAALTLLGHTLENVRRMSYLMLVHPDDRAKAGRFYLRQFARRQPESYYEMRCLARDGSTVWLGQNVQLLMEGPLVTGFQVIARDVTESMIREQKLKQDALVDSLTGLANRRCIQKTLELAVSKARNSGMPVSLCVCDLDEFKQINDRHGHGCGDEVLQAFGRLLKDGIREQDLAGRLGGDEFCIILPATAVEDAATTARRLRRRFEGQIFAGESPSPFRATATFGVAEWKPGMIPEDLMRASDTALYLAKHNGRNSVHACS